MKNRLISAALAVLLVLGTFCTAAAIELPYGEAVLFKTPILSVLPNDEWMKSYMRAMFAVAAMADCNYDINNMDYSQGALVACDDTIISATWMMKNGDAVTIMKASGANAAHALRTEGINYLWISQMTYEQQGYYVFEVSMSELAEAAASFAEIVSD